MYAKINKNTGIVLGHYTPEIHEKLFDSKGVPLTDDLIKLSDVDYQRSINCTLMYVDGKFVEYIKSYTKEEKYSQINTEYSAKIARVCQVGVPSTEIDNIINKLREEWKQKLLEVI